MLKVFGAVMTIAGLLSTLFIVFLIYNSDVVQEYNKAAGSIVDSGYLIPLILALLVLVAGIIFAASPEAQDRME